MVRRNSGGNAKVEAKKDVVQSRAISLKVVMVSVAMGIVALLTVGAKEVRSQITGNASKAELLTLYKSANNAKARAHSWAHKRKAGHRYHRALSPVTTSLAAEQARAKQWQAVAKSEHMAYKKYLKEKKAEALRFASANHDFHLALKLASQHYGVSYQWLHACAHSEGHIHGYRYSGGRPQKWRGKDPFEMNHSGSPAGGWAQFFESTFNAYPQARTPIPKQYRKWRSKLGQAYTMAYVFSREGSRQWTGAGC